MHLLYVCKFFVSILTSVNQENAKFSLSLKFKVNTEISL